MQAVVKAYIETGEPVGSKALTGLLKNAPSSATLRNEMNELCTLGLLSQPHTSAGRIPTSSGYRFYISSLKPAPLSVSTKEYIDLQFSSINCGLKEMPCVAGNILCELTGFPSVVSYAVGSGVYLRKAELITISLHSAVILMITSDGRADNAVVRLQSGLNNELKSLFCDIVNNRLKGRPLSDFNMATLQNIISLSGLNSFALMPIFTALFEMAQKADSSSVNIIGSSNLYNLFGDDGARRIMSLAERGEPLISAMGNENVKTEVIFGNDTLFNELSGKTLVVSRYSNGKTYCGKIGILGRGRMSYEQIIPSIEYTALCLTSLMTQAVKDMED
ncbi:MAG: hypothetical protein MJ076_00260 [Clostridia bacterium]|nr:hypothetical protein [Clostridia bacterium]